MIRLAAASALFSLLVLGGCAAHDPSDPGAGNGPSTERGPLGKADGTGSCASAGKSYCGGQSDGNCWCDDACAKYGDCCSDIASACGKSSGPVISFGADWTESVSGALTKGAEAGIAYDPDRLTACRGEQGGYQQWAITAQYRLDGGAVQSVVVAGNGAYGDPKISLEHRGDLELWFQNTNRWGCVAYDSNFGDNYHFAVK